MKKIRCATIEEDFLKVRTHLVDEGVVVVSVKCGGNFDSIYLIPDDIRKLRKQLKKALVAIEGVQEDEA